MQGLGPGPGAGPHQKVVWEQLLDAKSGHHCYWSNVSKAAQWAPPRWLDVWDEKRGRVYYFHTETREATWYKPFDFVSTVPLRLDLQPTGVSPMR
jgi:hypothetical protein